MNKFTILILLSCVLTNRIVAQSPVVGGTGFNYSTFTIEKRNITTELQSLTDIQFIEHPEYGILPYNAPCTDCFELLQKRDETHRYFVKDGSKGKEFYQQTSYGSMSYNANGQLHTIDSRLRPSGEAGVFIAQRQPSPVTINIPEKFSSLTNAGTELQVNRNVHLYIRHKDGSETSLGEPDWSNYTAGDNGIIVYNFYPGIDLKLLVGKGSIESFYIVNRPLSYLTDGWLIIRDNMKVPEALMCDFTYSQKKENDFYEGTLFINGKDGNPYYYIGTPAAFDENVEGSAINLTYQITEAGVYSMYIPIDWMNDARRSYPLIVDPLVTAVSRLPQASITGSGYNAVCFKNGCSYNLDVTVPAGCNIVDIIYSFDYQTIGTCVLNTGAWDIKSNTCRSPSNSTSWKTCQMGLPGLCSSWGLSCYSEFQSCLVSPQCSTYTMPVVLTFYRCVQPGTGCGYSCVNAYSDWSMTVKGRTLEVALKDSSICLGSTIDLTADAIYGVFPKTYTWYPGGHTGQTISVSPSITSIYTVTVTNCGGLDSAQATATITTGKTVKVTTQDTSMCSGLSVDLTAFADSGIPPYTYTWYPGGIIGKSINVSPAVTTTYTVFVTDCGGLYANDSAHTTSTIVVKPLSDTYNPGFTFSPNPVCTYNMVTLNGLGSGAQANYNWLLPGSVWNTYIKTKIGYAQYQTAGVYNIILNYDNGSCLFPDTQQITVLSCVGLEESALSNLFALYPNPANTHLTLESSLIHPHEAVKASIMNVLGETVLSFPPFLWRETGGEVLAVKSLAPGIYFVQVESEQGRSVKRFVKE